MASAQSITLASHVQSSSPGPGITLVAQNVENAELHLDAHGLEVHAILQLAHAAGGGQQRLGGDTAPVHAGASDVVALYHCCLQPLHHDRQG